MARHNILGKAGEDAAMEYLLINGYTVLDRNWRSGHYELDIVAAKDGVLISIEVKTRKSDIFYNPEEAVTPTKIRRILRATNAYICQHGIRQSVRFDVISVVGDVGNFRIEHIREAFVPQQF